jgi:tetratricopeptide (TPR) repeat protein
MRVSGCKMVKMSRTANVVIFVILACIVAAAQQNSPNASDTPPKSTQAQGSSNQTSAEQDSAAPDRRSDDESSSSTAHRVDITPPKNDAKDHPFSADAVEEAEPPTDVQEFHPWDPHRAAKNVEVGEFYLKRKNYRAAESRFREALVYKSDYAIAKYRLGETLEKLGEVDDARANYEGYLKILPHGPLSEDAQKALERLSKKQQSKN